MQTCLSPLPKEEKREVLENKITLHSLEKAVHHDTAEMTRGHAGR